MKSRKSTEFKSAWAEDAPRQEAQHQVPISKYRAKQQPGSLGLALRDAFLKQQGGAR